MNIPEKVSELPGVASFSKVVGESDVARFAEITGDMHPVHIDEAYASRQPVGRRIAHGMLILGFMATACTTWALREGLEIVSYG